MSFVRTLRKLLFGETLLLPVGLAVVVAASLLLRALLDHAWADVGGFVVLAGVVAVLVLIVVVTARPASVALSSRRRWWRRRGSRPRR
jgi:uncharacterized membrane protein YdbT with pleckstrin-like domain